MPRISATFKYPLQSSVQKDLIEHLKAVKHRTYLWLHLIFDVILSTQESTTRRMRDEIERLPETVDAAYERLLSRADETARSQTMNIFHIILGATRPVNLKELNIALRIKDKLDDGQRPRSLEDLDLDDDGPFEELIRNHCGLLVTVVNKTVFLLHQTVKDFLVAKADSDAANTLASQRWFWRHKIVLRESNFILAEICTTYLLFAVLELQPLPTLGERNPRDQNWTSKMLGLLPKWRLEKHQLDVVSKYASTYPFLDYAASCWTSHFQHCSIPRQEQLSQSFLQLFDSTSDRFYTWIAVSQKEFEYEEDFSEPGMAYFFGLGPEIRCLIEAGTTEASLDPVLRLAAKDGNLNALRFLIRNGASVCKVDPEIGRTALIIASSCGYDKAVELLLLEGADPNVITASGVTALTEAAEGGYGRIVEILLFYGANIDARRVPASDGPTSLIIAAAQGHQEVVDILVSNGADVNAYCEGWGPTAFAWAVQNGDEDMI